MTQKINDKLKKCCELCQSHLDKPCAWLSLGNEYCDTIMEVQSDIEIKDKVINEVIEEYVKSIITEKQFCPIINDKVKNCARYDVTCDICMKEYFYKKARKKNVKDKR